MPGSAEKKAAIESIQRKQHSNRFHKDSGEQVDNPYNNKNMIRSPTLEMENRLVNHALKKKINQKAVEEDDDFGYRELGTFGGNLNVNMEQSVFVNYGDKS